MRQASPSSSPPERHGALYRYSNASSYTGQEDGRSASGKLIAPAGLPMGVRCPIRGGVRGGDMDGGTSAVDIALVRRRRRLEVSAIAARGCGLLATIVSLVSWAGRPDSGLM